jgi:hypothetical protein
VLNSKRAPVVSGTRQRVAWVAVAIVGAFAVHQLSAGSRSGAGTDEKSPSVPAPVDVSRQTFPVNIRPVREPSGVATGKKDAHGRDVVVTCATCHGQKPPRKDVRTGSDLVRFHQGLKMSHAGLSCVSCHNPEDGYTTLRLADGTAVEFADTMTMCAQCHGVQFRDYQHGSHGGMTGYWDLTRGPRERNHCVDCHDPHAPQFPVVLPARPPGDRFVPKHEH